jgi:hypothetical protein
MPGVAPSVDAFNVRWVPIFGLDVSKCLLFWEPMEDVFLDLFQLMRNLTYDGTCFEKSLSPLLSNYVYNALKN